MKITNLLLFITAFCLSSWTASAQIDPKEQWPQFRGYRATGILDLQNTPVDWNLESGKNIKWVTDIPGLGHSCPVVWGNKIFITTADGGSSGDELKVGLYGDIDMANDTVVHQFKVYCLDKKTGKIIWERIAHEGVPTTKRHTKSSHANPTPATDGKNLVVFFGSEGLYNYDLDGNLIWKQDLGRLNAGPYNETDVEWGFGASPIIYQNRVIVQCDVLDGPFIASLDLANGKQIWKKERDEVATWSSPAIYDQNEPIQIIVNGWKHMGGYDFNTGEEIWKMSGGGDAPAPTPVIAHNHIYLNNAHGRYSPIWAIRPSANGDITLGADENSNNYISWCVKRGGAYMQTPLIVDDLLYNLQVNGALTCFNALTGKEIYKVTLAPKAFTASGVASDGKLYFAAESGEVYVVQAGPEFKLLNENNLHDIIMATPAISAGMIIWRTQHRLVAVGGPDPQ